jgi:hypothetical protein
MDTPAYETDYMVNNQIIMCGLTSFTISNNTIMGVSLTFTDSYYRVLQTQI